jgi:membrane carboxypeptidase/penicillin-binding protein PbpC
MDQRPMKKVSGITGAGPVLSRVASYLMKNKFLAKEALPENIQRHRICALSGKAPGAHCSHLKTELFVQGTKSSEVCSFHHELTVKDCHETGDLEKIGVIILPEKYKAFIDQDSSWSIETQVSKICTLRDPVIAQITPAESDKVSIVRPLPESIFAIDPNIPRNLQRLKLELNRFADVKQVHWKENGTVLSEERATMDWPMEKGKHSFEAEVEFLNGKVEKTEILNVTVL